MVFKFIATLALLGVASASLIRSDLGWNAEPAFVKTIEEHDSHPQYTYTYGVEDSITGDSKGHIETRDGDIVHGEYALNDADGYRRTVKYTADSLNGFNAIVDRKPLIEAAPVEIKTVEHVETPLVVKTVEPIAAPLLTKTIEHVPAPVVLKTVAPVTYTAPTYSAPTLIKSLPISYSAPAFIKSAPIAYSSPIHIKSIPSTYLAKSSFEPTFAYGSGLGLHKSAHLAYSAPSLLRSAPFAYAGSVGYTRSLPTVSQW